MNESDLYKESCAMFRHYSSASLTTRVTLVAQGLILLSGTGYLYNLNEFTYAALVASFGLVFTIVLFLLHRSYQHKCNVFVDVAISLEKTILLDDKTMTYYSDDHNKRSQFWLSDLFITNSFFVLMILVFSFLAIGTLFQFSLEALNFNLEGFTCT